MKFKARVFAAVEAIRASYWFVPSLMAVGAVILSYTMVWMDHAVSDERLKEIPWLYAGAPAGARTLLATIASSMIGLAGVVFSITIVALTLASGQFGSRLLRNFMRDRGNQITLGTFLSTFLYCLLLLRTIQGGNDDNGSIFVPQLGMLVAVIMAVAGLGVLIFFIHHTATSIQAPNIIADVARELSAAIRTLYPERLGESLVEADASKAAAQMQISNNFDEESAVLRAEDDGYVQRIEADQIMATAKTHDLIVRIEHRPGQFVQQDDVVLHVWPRERTQPAVLDNLRNAFAISDQRSLDQDAEFALEQLVEIAARALSPGVNDPFTAIQCVDRLGAALSELAARQMPSPYRMDEAGHLRVLTYPKTFSEFLDIGYNQIRQYAEKSLDVLLRMLEAIERIAHHIRREDDRQCLLEHAKMVYDSALALAGPDRDRRTVERRYAKLQTALRGSNDNS